LTYVQDGGEMDIIANGVRLSYEEVGAGHPVVCMHGLGLNMNLFRHLVPALRQQYRVITYDLRGMGKSEAPGRRGVTHPIELHIDDLAGLLDALSINHTAIVAHAFGAFVSTRFAIQRPDRVSAMVVFNTTAMMGEPGTTQALNRALSAELYGMDEQLDLSMSRWFIESFHREHPEVIQFYREMLRSTPPFGYSASARALTEFDVRQDLGKIRCPTLVVAGEHDWSTPPEHHEVIAKGIPGARLVIIENASHTVPEEQPEEFNRVTLDFLDQTLKPT
jgi:3-oxoadipate enol-lactonase